MKKYFGILILTSIICLAQCKQIDARRPISNSTSSRTNLAIAQDRKMVVAEDKKINEYIATNQLEFERSNSGFYYRFIKKDSAQGKKPMVGDELTFSYDVVNLKGDTLYKKEELSPITKSLETEYGIFKGMREALKLMQVGDRMEVIFPYYTAYGFYGNEDKIGSYVTFKSDVSLLGINKSETND